MAIRMIGPDGRDVITVPAGGATALRALGWTELSTPPQTTNTEPKQTAENKPKPKPRAKKTNTPRRRVPKPGDHDE